MEQSQIFWVQMSAAKGSRPARFDKSHPRPRLLTFLGGFRPILFLRPLFVVFSLV